MSSPSFLPLQWLNCLDSSSPDFENELHDILYSPEYVGCEKTIGNNDLVWLIDYLDKALDCLDPSGLASRKCLRELRSICSARVILPPSCILPPQSLETDSIPFTYGGSCDVYKGTLDGSRVCVKHIRVYAQDAPQAKAMEFYKEAVTWKHLAHPNVLPLLGITIKPFQLISNWVPGGSLPEYIRDHPDADRYALLCDVVEGLRYLHSRSVIHGDLKGANILVETSGHVRIADFGLAKITKNLDSIRTASHQKGFTMRWAAPEVLKGAYSEKADVYSLALVMIEVFTGAIPFNDRLDVNVMVAAEQGERPPRPTHPDFTDSLWKLMQHCWDADPDSRPEVSEVLRILLDANPPIWKQLIDPTLSINGRIDLMKSIFSDCDEAQVLKYASRDDAQALVDVVDEALEVPDIELDLRKKIFRILRKVCGSQAILPRSSTLSDNVTKEGDIQIARGKFADIWEGRHNGNRVCIKAFRVVRAQNPLKIKRRLFQEVAIWRHLSHPNLLPVLGVSPKLFSLCIITQWMINGDITDFVSEHPEVNRFHLLAELANGLQYLHSRDIVHSSLKPTNILIDHDFRPRLTDYGLIAIVSDPTTVEPGDTSPSLGTVRYMAPELLNPSGFGLKGSNPTKDSDIYALGMVTYQVTTGLQPFPGAEDKVIVSSVVTGKRPGRPPGPNEWVSDDVWNLISRCWSPSLIIRPDVGFVMNILNGVADVVEVKCGTVCATNKGQEGRISRREFGAFLPSGPPERRNDPPVQDILPPSQSTAMAPESKSPFVIEVPASSRAKEKKKQRKVFRMWYDSTGFYQQEAAIVDYTTGIVHLCSPDGILLDVAESELSSEDLRYVRSLGVWRKAQRRTRSRLPPSIPGSHISSDHQPYMPTTTSQSPRSFTTSMTKLEAWELDLVAFFRGYKPGLEGGTENEETRSAEVRGPGAKESSEREKAQIFADRLDLALDNERLPQQKRTQYLKCLLKLCGTFGILPSSLILAPEAFECEDKPFVAGSYSGVIKATFKGCAVVVKTLRMTGMEGEVRRLIAKEMVGRKCLQHKNILPFVGVAFTPLSVSIVSALMENGNIMGFIKANQRYNRLSLLVGAVTGLKFMHDHGVVHGNLKGANILIDSNCCARLADLGVAVVVDQTTSGETKGPRWMAPELIVPDRFKFVGESLKQLPSKSTDIYAIGMTILEVLTGCRPFSDMTDSVVILDVCKGKRPCRPPFVFTDKLWKLVVATWVEQYVDQPQKRPPVSTVLDRLKESVDDWEKAVNSVVSKQRQESEITEDRGEDVQRGPIFARIASKFKKISGLG